MVLPRKAHKKSRQGCTECKHCHIKCDENHPICGNCNISMRHCSYESMVSKARAVLQQSRPSSQKVIAINDDGKRSSSGSITREEDDSLPVNVFHLELFQHFVTGLLLSFGLDRFIFGNSAVGVTGSMLAASYLMNQLLAFSVFHLSVICPAKRGFYSHHAAQLQTHALAVFNRTSVELNTETCLPMLLFSSFIAMHMLCEKLVFRLDSFEAFLDHFIQSLRLHRGVYAIISQSWHLLSESPLKSVFDVESQALEHGTPGDECFELLSLMNATSIDPSLKDTYRQTIEHLQKAINGS